MALTLGNFVGWETGGLEEAAASAGAPVLEETTIRTGTYSLQLPGSLATSHSAVINIVTGGVTSAGNNHILGFAVRFEEWPLATDLNAVFGRAAGAPSTSIRIRYKSNGDLVVLDIGGAEVITASTGISADTWHFIELYWENSDSGEAELFIDGVSKGTTTGKDFLAAGGTLIDYNFLNAFDSGDNIFIDDIYMLSGATAAADRLGDAEVFKYQSVKASATPDDGGGNLNNGEWEDCGQTPLETASGIAEYTGAGAGAVDSNATNGSPEGPQNDARIDGDSNIKGIKGISNMQRAGGGASDHFILLGNDGDGTTRSADLDPPTAFTTFFFLSELATIVPLSTEYCRIGFETTGNQDYECHEQWAMLLHVPALFDPATMAAMDRPWPDIVHARPEVVASGMTPSVHQEP